MISKTDERILLMMLEKCDRLCEICNSHTDEEIEENYLFSDTIQFEFEKLYEDMTRLSAEFRMSHKELHIDDMRGIRNRVAHNYESVSLKILIDTARSDIPNLKEALANIIKKAA